MALIKSPEQIKNIRQSARILAATLRKLRDVVVVGTNLMELEELAVKNIEDAGGKPAFLGYQPEGAKEAYPFALCSSINDVIVHGQPHDYALKEGDLLKLDLGVNWRGGISDSAITIPVGKIANEDERLMKITKDALKAGIDAARGGNTIGDIGHAIEKTITEGGGRVVDGLTGHGTGEKLHEEPSVYNFGEPGGGMELKPGMVLALEPMVSLKTNAIRKLADDSFVTADGSKSAHFEHTILITEGGAEVLTSRS